MKKNTIYLGWIPGLKIGMIFCMRFFEKFEVLLQKIANDSVNHAVSWDIKVLVQFPGNSILKFITNFWKCVGVSLSKSPKLSKHYV